MSHLVGQSLTIKLIEKLYAQRKFAEVIDIQATDAGIITKCHIYDDWRVYASLGVAALCICVILITIVYVGPIVTEQALALAQTLAPILAKVQGFAQTAAFV
jgi:hypothetical protein